MRLQRLGILTLEPERLKNQLAHHQDEDQRMEGARHRKRSGSLWFQFFSVEAFSLLPQSQRDRGDLARQSEPCHRGFHALGEHRLVVILERSRTHTRRGCSRFEQTFQIMVVVLVQTPDREQLLGAPQLAFNETLRLSRCFSPGNIKPRKYGTRRTYQRARPREAKYEMDLKLRRSI